MKPRFSTGPGSSPPFLADKVKIAGLILVLAGLLLGLDQIIRTGWLTFLIFPLCGLVIIFFGYILEALGWIITGSQLLGLGVVAFLTLSYVMQQPLLPRLGYGLIAYGFCWLLVTLFSLLLHKKLVWWASIPAGVIIGAGVAIINSPANFVGYVFYICCGLGIGFLAWGLGERLFGLIIPGSLLMGIGPGIYFAWRDLIDFNALTQTGVMLVGFGFGWGLITILARRTSGKFIWWPLIPGGILAVAGWGLYIGGDPGNALGFIGNTGSVAMLVFGLYLLLMRKSMHP
jgi:hypothetical protein